MSKVIVTTTIGERVISAQVDREELAILLQRSKSVAQYRGLRPGEPSDLTKTSSDPISQERVSTLHLMLQSLSHK